MSAFERLLEQKAVALQYSPEKDTAPVIVASGMGYMAEKITESQGFRFMRMILLRLF